MWCCKDEDDSFKLKGDFSYNDHAVVGDVIVTFVSCYNQLYVWVDAQHQLQLELWKWGFTSFISLFVNVFRLKNSEFEHCTL